uniref:CUB-like domain-containing protein n=1 Tax=Plectus sambesii TaxID=2011161 RepID=A0A914X6A1_9BILA
MIQIHIFYLVVALGFFQQTSNAQTDTSNCKCPDNIDLTENKQSGMIQYPKLGDLTGLADCCTNCVSVITAPLGYQVEATDSVVHFQNDPNASLTMRNGHGDGGYILGKLDINVPMGTFKSLGNALTVTYSTDSFASSCPKVTYGIYARIQKLPVAAIHLLSSDQPFHLIMGKDLNSSDHYWTVTAETGKRVHLYLYGNLRGSDKIEIFIIDGSDPNGKLITHVAQLSDSTIGPLNATSSSGQSLIILLEVGTYFSYADFNLLFTQLENDPSECGTSELVFLTSSGSSAVNVNISNHGGNTTSCPAVLILNIGYSSNPVMRMNVSSLQGSMVLYEGLDYPPSSNNEIIRFSSMDNVISPMKVAGRVFVVLLTPGSMINLDFTTTYLTDDARGGSGTKGLIMSENFPHPNMKEIADRYYFVGVENNHYVYNYNYSINILQYDLGTNGSLSINSSVLVLAPEPELGFGYGSGFSKILNGTRGNTTMQFCANIFEVKYNSNGVGQKGFVLTYDAVLKKFVHDLSNHTRIFKLGLKTITVLKNSVGAKAFAVVIQAEHEMQLHQELQAGGEVFLDQVIVDADIVFPHAGSKLDQDELSKLSLPDLFQNFCAVIASL